MRNCKNCNALLFTIKKRTGRVILYPNKLFCNTKCRAEYWAKHNQPTRYNMISCMQKLNDNEFLEWYRLRFPL